MLLQLNLTRIRSDTGIAGLLGHLDGLALVVDSQDVDQSSGNMVLHHATLDLHTEALDVESAHAAVDGLDAAHIEQALIHALIDAALGIDGEANGMEVLLNG